MDLHFHCYRCHTVTVRRTSSSHACGGEEEVRALSQAKRKKSKKKGARAERQRFQVSTSRLLALASVFLGILIYSQIGYYP
jgi:hypothetical protein